MSEVHSAQPAGHSRQLVHSAQAQQQADRRTAGAQRALRGELASAATASAYPRPRRPVSQPPKQLLRRTGH